MEKNYTEVILGGTFDHLHKGHKALLDAAFVRGTHVTIGLTTAPLYQKKFLAQSIEPFEKREQSLVHYFNEQKYSGRATIIPLTDIYGTSLTDRSIEAIFVTEVTYHNALLINKARGEKGLPPLRIHIVPFVHGNDGEIITSQRIRYGEINREGHPYLQLFVKKPMLLLPDSLRKILAKPLGPVAPDITSLKKLLSDNALVITVGDVVSQSVDDAGIPVILKIIDQRNRRGPIAATPLQESAVKNQAGRIEQEAVLAYQQSLKKYFAEHQTQTLVIDGEEDLLALPAILLAPMGSFVLYGQYGEGIVVNRVDEAVKATIQSIIEKFV